MKFPWMKDNTATTYIVVENVKGHTLRFSDQEDDYGFSWVKTVSVANAERFDERFLRENVTGFLIKNPPKHGYTCLKCDATYTLKEVDFVEEEERRAARAKLTERERTLLGLEDD